MMEINPEIQNTNVPISCKKRISVHFFSFLQSEASSNLSRGVHRNLSRGVLILFSFQREGRGEHHPSRPQRPMETSDFTVPED